MTPPIAADNLAEKEFSLIQEISKSPTRTQRDLSNSIGLSLGMTNLLIKRLARKGLIKVKQLDWNKTQYLLTLKGVMEKAKKSYNYTRYTIRIFRQIEENIELAMRREYQSGVRNFTVVAQDEIMDLVRDTLQDLDLGGVNFSFVRRFADVPASAGVVLTATLESAPAAKNGQRFLPVVDFENLDFRVGQ